jgi:predicted transposase YbfD/YdcC
MPERSDGFGLRLKAEEAMQYARNHWAVENKLHWQLDVTLREDEKRNRMGFSAQNLSLLRTNTTEYGS